VKLPTTGTSAILVTTPGNLRTRGNLVRVLRGTIALTSERLVSDSTLPGATTPGQRLAVLLSVPRRPERALIPRSHHSPLMFGSVMCGER
jgi:hypothetical protein